MVNLLNLTAAAATATRFNIMDHQNLVLDLVNGGCEDYTTVQQFGRGPVTTQEWSLNHIGPIDSDHFQITNVGCGTVLSYAGSATGANSIRSQLVNLVKSNTTWFVVSDVNSPSGGVRIIESVSSLALTAWTADPIEATAPLTLEPNRAKDTRQNFFLSGVAI